MSANNFIYLEHAESGHISVVEKDMDSGENYGKKRYFKTLQKALDHCAELLPEVEYGILLGRGFGELSDQGTHDENES